MKAAVISENVVVNVIIVYDLSFDIGEGFELVPADGIGIGWTRDADGVFHAPEGE